MEQMRGLVIISALGKQESSLPGDAIGCFCTGASCRHDCLCSLPSLIRLSLKFETAFPASGFLTLGALVEATYIIK